MVEYFLKPIRSFILLTSQQLKFWDQMLTMLNLMVSFYDYGKNNILLIAFKIELIITVS